MNNDFTREELLADMQTIARSLKKLLDELDMINPQTGQVEMNLRRIMQLLPALMQGQLSGKFAFISELKPLLEKYQHLADQ